MSRCYNCASERRQMLEVRVRGNRCQECSATTVSGPDMEELERVFGIGGEGTRLREELISWRKMGRSFARFIEHIADGNSSHDALEQAALGYAMAADSGTPAERTEALSHLIEVALRRGRTFQLSTETLMHGTTARAINGKATCPSCGAGRPPVLDALKTQGFWKPWCDNCAPPDEDD